MQIKLSALVLASAVLAAAAFTSTPAVAAVAGATTVHVPFSFNIQGQTLPAGDYRVQRDSSGNFVQLQAANGGQAYAWIASAGANNNSRVVLRFDGAGDGHALHSVQFGPLVTGRLDKKLKTEDMTPIEIVGQ